MFVTGKNVVGEHALTLLHSKWPKLHRVLASLSAIGLSSLLKMDGRMDDLRFYILFNSTCISVISG